MSMRRRQFLGSLGAGLLGGLALAGTPTPNWRALPRRKAVQTLGTARNLIFILLEGGPSHVDTFDYKKDRSTPAFLGPQDMGGWVWPAGIMPKLAARKGKFSLVRSIAAVEAVHERAVYHLMTSHRQSAALANEIPDFASVLSYKMAAQRRPGDSLPTVMKVGELTPGPGFFGVEHAGLFLSEEGRVRNLRHEFENGDRRMALMDNLLKDLKTGSDTRADHMRNLGQARKMMTDQTLIQLLGIPETGENEEGGEEEMEENNFLAQCQTAARVIAADKGTRVFQMTLFGWDHHDNIYDQNNPGALPGLARALDDGVAYLIDDLGSKPASSGTGTLLDETLIVAVGEFGRTVNGLNTSAGRDHFPYVLPALFAGGGVKGGRAVGSSSADGSYIQDRGWSHSHYMGINDLAATIYSALGIDWTERFADTPSGRVFEMVDMTVSNQVAAIDPLFV